LEKKIQPPLNLPLGKGEKFWKKRSNPLLLSPLGRERKCLIRERVYVLLISPLEKRGRIFSLVFCLPFTGKKIFSSPWQGEDQGGVIYSFQ